MSRLPDQAEVHKQSVSEIAEERKRAASELKSAFQNFPDKTDAWRDLIKLVHDNDISVRWRAADALGSAFLQVPDKNLAALRCSMLLTPS
jgi:HEAT repeat protein